MLAKQTEQQHWTDQEGRDAAPEGVAFSFRSGTNIDLRLDLGEVQKNIASGADRLATWPAGSGEIFTARRWRRLRSRVSLERHTRTRKSRVAQ